MKISKSIVFGALFLGVACPALAFVGFVTISPRDKVIVTIYNKADLTLVRDQRRVVFKAGKNNLRYGWAGTLIDPTSLHVFPPSGVELRNTTFPLNEGGALGWQFEAQKETAGPLAMQYFTSGLTWRADHVLVLIGDGKASLETWVKVENNSGEDYDNAHVRLVVGEARLIETIQALVDKLGLENKPDNAPSAGEMERVLEEIDSDKITTTEVLKEKPQDAKAIFREELSELHLYNIEGTESIPNQGARRMRAFAYQDVSVRDVYRCFDPQEKIPATRVLSFKNSKDNKMGSQPLPEGQLQVFRKEEDGLAYEGRGYLPYTPMKEEAEIPVGNDNPVTCELRMLSRRNTRVQKNDWGLIKGHEENRTYRLRLVNGNLTPAYFEVRLHLPPPFRSSLEAIREDQTTQLFKVKLGPVSSKEVTYEVWLPKGSLLKDK